MVEHELEALYLGIVSQPAIYSFAAMHRLKVGKPEVYRELLEWGQAQGLFTWWDDPEVPRPERVRDLEVQALASDQD